MNSKIITIWDKKGPSTYPSDSTIYWSGYYNKNTIPQYLENNAQELRLIYLSFIHDLGELNISGKQLIDHLEVEDGFSLWWMTLLAEKSYLKSSRIFDSLRLLALDKKLNEIKPDIINLVSSDCVLAKAIKK